MTTRRNFLVSGSMGAAIAATGCSRSSTPPSLSALDLFKSSFDGDVLSRDDAQFDSWREGLLWQMDAPARRPNIITRPKTLEAIRSALTYARDAGLKVAIKSGGHNISAAFMRDSGLLLDLGAFGNVVPKEGAGEAWVEPAAWSWNIARAIEPMGYSFPYAHCATVSMGGYLLGGGVGINGDAWGGIACHSVTGLKIMLANGDVVIADESQNTDLFWAARGGGTGFFGIILAYRLKLYPRANDVHERILLYPIEAAEEVSAWLESLAEISPKNIELLILLAHRPPPMQGPTPESKRMCIARLAAFGEQEGDAAHALSTLNAIPPPRGSFFAPRTAHSQ